ncbi:MAG: DUF2793 domain-containing protein [Rickettsiales bacterium]|nr:DUF2793 domain-containing protein [Rickettsiales bacterium]
MVDTPHTLATLVETAQAQKEVTVNEALVRLDALLNTGVIDRDLATPPASPAQGDVYIVAASPTGLWAGKATQIAYFDQVWRFIPARAGVCVWLNDEQALCRFSGSIWEVVLPTQRTRCLRLMPDVLRPAASGGAASITRLSMGANAADIHTLDFDAATQETAHALVALPRQWDRQTVYAQIVWSHAATTVNFGVTWSLAAVAMGDAETLTTAYGTAITVNDVGGATNTLYISDFSAPITVAGSPQVGDAVFLRIQRLATDAADTLAIDARLHEVRLYYTVWDAGNE